MAVRTPLVIINGRIQELPVGDTIAGAPAGPAGTGGTGISPQTGTAGEDLVVGETIYIDKVSGQLFKAVASSAATGMVAGIVTVAATTGNTASYLTEGVVSISDWTPAIGTANLVVGCTYFLDPVTPGQLTTTAPVASGQVVAAVGRATASQVLDLTITQPILL